MELMTFLERHRARSMARMDSARRALDKGFGVAAKKKDSRRDVREANVKRVPLMTESVQQEADVPCGSCGRPVGVVHPVPWARWTCDVCGKTYLNTTRGSEPLWGCSSAKRCCWAMCEGCHAQAEGEARRRVPQTNEQTVDEVLRAGKRPKHSSMQETSSIEGHAEEDHMVNFDPELDLALLASTTEQGDGVSVAKSRERLEHALDLYGASAIPVKGDGNCQFRALAQQLHGGEDPHRSVRARVLQQLKVNADHYAPFVHEPFARYLERMARDGEWGDHVTLQAASDTFGVQINVFTDMPEAPLVEVLPAGGVTNPTHQPLCLTFLTEIHYDAAKMC